MGRRQDPGRHPQRGGAAWLVLGAACTVLGAGGNGLQLAGDSPSDDRAASDVAGDELYGVSASPGGDVWILGRYGTALQRVGSSWRQHCVPLAWGPSDWGPVLLDVWPDGAGQAWIAGWSGIARWDGRAWSVTPDVLPPAREYEQGTLGLWGSSPHDLWAVGAGGGIAHWTGDAWSRVDSGTTEHLHDVFGLSSDVAWAGGDGGTLLRWDGSAWSRLPTPFCRPLMASCDAGYLWASGVDDLYVTVTVCTGTYPFEECSDRLWHWDGTDWTSMEWPRGMGIWGTAADDVWIASRTLGLLHWDGATLVDVPLDGDAAISGMGGPAGNDVWFTRTDGAILHWDGTSLARTTPDRPEIGGLGAVWGIYPDDVWVVGDESLGVPLVEHWDGEDWSPAADGLSAVFDYVWGAGPDDVWMTGILGRVARWDGGAWRVSEDRSLGDLMDIWTSPDGTAWTISGRYDAERRLLRYDGAAWSDSGCVPTSHVSAVWGDSAGTIWAVGRGGVLRWREP